MKCILFSFCFLGIVDFFILKIDDCKENEVVYNNSDYGIISEYFYIG